MSYSDELNKLAALHAAGSLSDEEFARAKARVIGGVPPGAAGAAQPGGAPIVDALNGLRRSRMERWVGGVCGGLAQATGLAAWLWRIAFVLLTLCAGGGLLVYLLMWIFVPEDGEPVRS